MRPLLIDVTLYKGKWGVEEECERVRAVDTNCHKRGVIRRTCLNFSKSALARFAVYLQSVLQSPLTTSYRMQLCLGCCCNRTDKTAVSCYTHINYAHCPKDSPPAGSRIPTALGEGPRQKRGAAVELEVRGSRATRNYFCCSGFSVCP